MIRTDHKNTLIQLVLVPFLVLNVIFPRSFSVKIDYSTLTDILKSQSTILGYTSFAVIPMRIVQELFNQHVNPDQTSKDTGKENKKTPSPVTDLYTFSIVKTLKKSDCFKSSWRNDLPLYARNHPMVFENTFRRIDDEGVGGLGIFILMLICILMLPRGSIDDYIISSFKRSKNTAKQIFSRVFFISKYKVLSRGYHETN